MKTMKKILAILLVVMLFASICTVSAWAAGEGSITLKNATKGYAYQAYKILDATYTEVTVEDPETGASTKKTLVSYTTETPALFNSDDAAKAIWKVSEDAVGGKYSVQLASESVTAEQINTWIKNNLDQFSPINPTSGADGEVAIASQLTWTGLDLGYYYITSGLGATVTVDTTTPNPEVIDKNTATDSDPQKTIVAIDNVAADNPKAGDAHVGSQVDFSVTAITTNWTYPEGGDPVIRTEWTMEDKPTNMEIIPGSIIVKFNNVELAKGTDYTVVFDSTGKMDITVPMVDSAGNSIFPANVGAAPGQIPIEITYSAVITAAAASAPAKNEIPSDNPPPPPVVICTYAFQVAKTDGTDPLPGAQFELWSAKAGSTAAALTFINNGDGTYTFSENAPEGVTLVTKLDMTTNTTIVIKGLDTAWDYILKEITVPSGYNQAEDIDIDGADLTKVEEKIISQDGVETTVVVDTTVTSTQLYKETVVNKAGAELPSTGGIGTTIFYVVGGMLLIGAAVMLITKKRISQKF